MFVLGGRGGLKSEQACRRGLVLFALFPLFAVQPGASGDAPLAKKGAVVAAGEHPPGVSIDKGAAHATIVIPANAGPLERAAANDLQYVLEKMTGVALPIAADSGAIEGNRILIGETRFTGAIVPREERAALGKEGYIARLRGRDLALVGGGPYGHVYAVDELYDRLGVRFYMPGPLGECIPKLDSVRFDALDVKRQPSFPMRWIGTDTQWNLRNRANRMKDENLPPSFTVLPSLYHSQARLLPVKEYGKTHPEYFAWNGKRRLTDVGDTKLCNSNPGVAHELARNMAAIVRQTPGIALISLSPTDNANWCQCDACKAMDDQAFVKDGEKIPRDQTYSRRQMVLYNRVAEELEKEFPDQTILVGAYNLYTWPPREPSVHANKNLAVVICHYQPEAACLAHPVNDPNCAPNARYLELIRAWQKQTPRIYFYEYYWKVNWLDMPWPIAHTVAADIPFFKANGFQGVSTQHTNSAIWGNFIPMYLAARLLWDHTADPKAIVEELYGKFYGEAAAPMKRFHEALEKQMASAAVHPAGAIDRYSDAIFSDSLMQALKADLAEAQSLARDEMVKKRLERVALMMDYTERLAGTFRLSNASKKAKGKESLDLLKQAYIQGDALRDDVLKRRDYYSGVASGAYFRGSAYMAGMLSGWRKKLVGAGALDPERYPDKGGRPKPAR